MDTECVELALLSLRDIKAGEGTSLSHCLLESSEDFRPRLRRGLGTKSAMLCIEGVRIGG